MNKLLVKSLFLTICCLVSVATMAQSHRNVSVEQGKPFTDHVNMKKGADDMDIIVKFMFNESENTLTVSLLSYRNLFVFNDNVRYGSVVKSSKLVPFNFPYVVSSEGDVKYRISKNLKQNLKKNGSLKSHIFKNWITYEGLQPKQVEYQMVNEYIEQKFDILSRKDTAVGVSLHDLLVMEPDIKKENIYNVFYYVDLNINYDIKILRDPCFDKQEQIKESEANVAAVKEGYGALQQSYKDIDVVTKESLAVLKQMQSIVKEQFKKSDLCDKCYAIQDNISLYNKYVDSIAQVGTLIMAMEAEMDKLDIEPGYILAVAKQIDNFTAKWLKSTDAIEKRDIALICEEMIVELESSIGDGVKVSQEQAEAIEIFKKAKSYFNLTCNSSREGK